MFLSVSKWNSERFHMLSCVWFKRPLFGAFITWTLVFLKKKKKDLYHPTGEFNRSPGLCVQFWTARAGNLVQARIVLMTKQTPIPLLIALLLSIICCSAEAGAEWISPQALCAELHIGSAGDLLGAPQVVVQLPGGGVAKRQPAGIALLLSPGNNNDRILLTMDQHKIRSSWFLFFQSLCIRFWVETIQICWSCHHYHHNQGNLLYSFIIVLLTTFN